MENIPPLSQQRQALPFTLSTKPFRAQILVELRVCRSGSTYEEYIFWSVDLLKDTSTGEKPEKNSHDDSKPGEDINVRTGILVWQIEDWEQIRDFKNKVT